MRVFIQGASDVLVAAVSEALNTQGIAADVQRSESRLPEPEAPPVILGDKPYPQERYDRERPWEDGRSKKDRFRTLQKRKKGWR